MALKASSQYALLCEQYLTILYQKIQYTSHNNNNISETYGEILYAGMNKLLSKIKFTDQDIFIDIGSGLGKIVAQVFLHSNVKEAHGIEISPDLHSLATAIAERIQTELPHFYEGNRKLNFILGNFLETPMLPATIAFINAICLPPTLLHALGDIINNTTSIHTVLTTRPIPTLQRLSFKKTIHIQCSWDSALCYVYQ